MKASAESAEDEANKLEAQAAEEMAKADALRDAQPALDRQLKKTNAALNRIKKSNGDLERQIADLKAKRLLSRQIRELKQAISHQRQKTSPQKLAILISGTRIIRPRYRKANRSNRS
ncbi:hypothetical protein O3W44_22735 [Pantoea sp. LMR881]|uniref:hypothetical protein n=1 Tax=Pantoea sp. LMR881 TaxID=3014336 RepID=UPI0022AE784A|nr:hypothetical protein [Pantoea sp. LMR881]MCZ4061351.1 hypothetical protein [Pantoea sp. LMR881]